MDTLKKLILTFSVLFLFSPEIFSQLVVNEIMYAPSDATNEWYELYNHGNSSISLQNWKWKDATSTLRTITTQNISLPSSGYIIICEDSVKFKNLYPAFAGKFIQTAWSALNNSGDNLIIIDPSNERIDSITFSSSWGGSSGGFSLERISPSSPSNNASSWSTSTDLQHSTPGRQNSITPKPFDLKLYSFSITPPFPLPGETLQLNIIIKNAGQNTANDFSIKLYSDINRDSVPDDEELVNSHNFPLLLRGDSLNYDFAIADIDTGVKQFIAMVNYDLDEDTLNNKLVRRVVVNSQSGGGTEILINEIMYTPSSPEPEWIEIYNGTNDPVNLKRWKIADSTGQNSPVTITSSDKFIGSGEYIVISKSIEIISKHASLDTGKLIILSSLPTLNNDRDKIILYNNESLIIDKVSYRSTWGGLNGHSLERRSFTGASEDSSGWASSVDCEHSSPGRINSVKAAVTYVKNDLVINEIMFDPLTGQPEWIELYNASAKNINIAGWILKDQSGHYSIADTCNFMIDPVNYFVLAKDSTIYTKFPYLQDPQRDQKVYFNKNLSLSNEGEPLVITDLFNNIIDSVYYNSAWHNSNITDTKGISLERINSAFGANDRSNWNSSANVNGGTPGLENSIFTKNISSNSNITITPNPFSPDGDGHEDFAVVKYKLSVPFAQMRIKVYDIKGRMVRELSNNQFTGNEGTIIFNGFGDDDQKLRIGIYILIIDAVDDKGGTIDNIKAAVVVAGDL